jgi:hypothetical protein
VKSLAAVAAAADNDEEEENMPAGDRRSGVRYIKLKGK